MSCDLLWDAQAVKSISDLNLGELAPGTGAYGFAANLGIWFCDPFVHPARGLCRGVSNRKILYIKPPDVCITF